MNIIRKILSIILIVFLGTIAIQGCSSKTVEKKSLASVWKPVSSFQLGQPYSYDGFLNLNR